MQLPTLGQFVGEWIYILMWMLAGIIFFLAITRPIDPEK